MRSLLLCLIFCTAISFGQDTILLKHHHSNFEKFIFKNLDSAHYYIKHIESLKGASNNYLPTYYYHQDLGQYYFVSQKMDSSEYHYQKAFTISSASNNKRHNIDSEIWLANHAHFKGESAISMAHWKNILKNSKDIGYVVGMGNAYSTFASTETDLQKKLDQYLQVESLFNSNNIEHGVLVNTYSAIARIYINSSGNEERAKGYMNKAVEMSKKISYPFGETSAYILLAETALSKNKYNEAIYNFKALLKLSVAINQTGYRERAYIGLAKTFLKMGDFKSAGETLEKINHLLEDTKGNLSLGWINLLWTEQYIGLKQPKKALDHLEQARLNPSLSRPNLFLTDLHRVETKYFEFIKNFEKAYQSKKKYDNLVNQLEEQKNTNGFILSEQQKIREKKEQEISLLKTQNELVEQRQKNQRNILLGGIFLTSFAGLLLYILFRNRHRTNKKLREIDTLKTNFFTSISHEFRTPLTLISTPIQESLEEHDLSEEKRNHFEIAQRSTKRLMSLVDQLLELSKIDSGNRHLIVEKNTPTQLIAAWCESFQYLAEQKKIDFEIDISKKEEEAWFDKEALENIVINLLGNAIKYTPEGGKIEFKVDLLNDTLNLVIGNTGEGLSKSQIKTIFNRFYQTDGHNEGAGVGLSLVKELVELHKGVIKVQSSPNKWTEFKLSLSLDKNKLGDVQFKKRSDQLQKTKLPFTEIKSVNEEASQINELPILLVVEDNADVRLLLKDTFKKEYAIIQAKDGEEGVTKALENIPDVIVSDLMMPVKDGIDLTKTLKEDERTSHIPIILLTAKAGDENELTGIEVGADDYITKPFNQKILKSKVASLISMRKKLQSRYSQEVILRPKDIAITNIDERFIEKVQLVLDENLVESSFTIEDFSKAVNMSRMQLHRKLKALTGLSASEFIRSQRLKLAAQILKQSDINVSEVGYNVGFNDHAYFSKCFKEVFKCTPSEFASKK